MHDTPDVTFPDWALVPSLRCDYARSLAQLLGLSPGDTARLIAGTALTPQTFAAADALISARDHILIFSNALKLSGAPGLGVLFGRRITAVSHGAMGFAVTHSANLAEAMQALVTFMPTRANYFTLSLDQQPEVTTIKVTSRLRLPPEIERFLTDTLFGAFYELASQIAGPQLEAVQAQVTHARPDDAGLYARHIPFTFQFSQDANQVVVPRALCLQPNAQADSQVYQIARQHCERLLKDADDRIHAGLEQRIVRMMLAGQPGTVTAEMAADALFMTPRTLARRLRQDGTSFRNIRDKVLSRQAVEMLSDPRLSVDAVAALMNFHDAASFRRAFKRWHGKPPHLFRKRLDSATKALPK
ncbi:MAG: AraC family transcriptional regulator ligand-binding domain-containing protein [Litorimonas sp.]